MADGNERSLIDLNCSVKGHRTSVPLLPLPKIKSPFEGDFSSDCNTPFDLSIQAASFLDDPFELVSKKVQEFLEIGKMGESGISTLESSREGVLVSEREESEKFKICVNVMTNVTVINSEETNGITESGFLDAHTLENPDVQEKRRSIESVDLLSHIKKNYASKSKPDINQTESLYSELEMYDARNLCSVNNGASIPSQTSNSKYSPESGSPKYSSTPIIVNYKRKVREGESPLSKKRASLDFGSLSPASFVRDRVEKCIAETQKKYRNGQETTGEFGRLTYRRSLDSQMPQYTNYTSGYQSKTFTSKQNHKGRYSLQATGETDSKDDFYCSFKSLQTSRNGLDIDKSPLPHFENVQNPKTSKCTALEDDFYLREAQNLSKLFEVAAKSASEDLIANESAIILVESDTELENSEENMTEEIDSKVEKSTTKTPSFAGKEDTLASFQNKRANTKLGSKTVAAEKSLKTLLDKVSQNVHLSSPKVKNTELTTPSHRSVSRVKSDSSLGLGKDATKFGKYSLTSKHSPRNKPYDKPNGFVDKQTPVKGTSMVGKASKPLKQTPQSKRPFLTSTRKN